MVSGLPFDDLKVLDVLQKKYGGYTKTPQLHKYG